MDFYQALMGKYRPGHYAGGGVIDSIGDALGINPQANTFSPTMPKINYDPNIQSIAFNPSQQVNSFRPEMASNSFNAALIKNKFGAADVQNGFDPNMPTNSFQAVGPNIDQMNFSGAINQGQGGVGQGLGALGGSYAAQQQLAAQGQQALGAQQGLYSQQQSLADALLAQSQGQGPNIPQMQLRQDTDRAIAQQATAIASQRGISPALAARMISQNAAQQNQQMAGQAATLGAQQQLAAQQALGTQQQAMGQNLLGQNATLANQGNLYNQAAGTAGTLGGLGAQLYGIGAQGAQNQNALTSQNSLATQGINAGVASQNAQLGAQGEALRAGVASQNADLRAHLNDINAQTAAQNATLAQQQQQLQYGVSSQNADLFQQNQQMLAAKAAQNAQLGQDYQGLKANIAGQNAQLSGQEQALQAGIAGQNAGFQAQGQGIQAGTAAQNVAAQNQFNTAVAGGLLNGAGAIAAAAHGGMIPDRQSLSLAQALMGQGGAVPGRGKVKGDSSKNDVVPTVLSPQEIVIPRSIAMAEDAPEKAAEFVAALKSKTGGAKGYGKILEKHRAVQKHMDELDAIIRSQVG